MVDISTSLLSVKKEKIIDTVYKLEDANTNYFHIDVMDGEFVENDTHDLMLEYCEYLDNITKIPLDIHLMVKDVKNFVDSYLILGKIAYDNRNLPMIIAPIGTKPHVIGAILYAIKHPTKVEILYDNPKRNVHRTEGIGRVLVCNVTKLFNEN